MDPECMLRVLVSIVLVDGGRVIMTSTWRADPKPLRSAA
jgi:hypothetical protein